MRKQAIGDTGLSVTEIGFGTAALGGMPDTYGHDVSEDNARATIHAIFDSPANLIDTSRNYGFGRSEARIGAVIRERGGLPDGPLQFCLSRAACVRHSDEYQRHAHPSLTRHLQQRLRGFAIGACCIHQRRDCLCVQRSHKQLPMSC